MTDLIRRLQEPPFGTETSERSLMAEAARAVIALHAELAQARVAAAAAVALVVEQAARKLESRAELLVQDEGSWEPDTNVTNLPEWAESECEVLEESARLIRALAPVDGLALLAELRREIAELRELCNKNGREGDQT